MNINMELNNMRRRSKHNNLQEIHSDSKVDHFRCSDKVRIKEKYDMGSKLGKGAFGTVRLIHEKETKEIYACKILRKPLRSPAQMDQLNREMEILKKVRHKYIVRMKAIYETADKVYLVMEYCNGGELVQRLQTRTKIKEDDVKIIITRLADAIAYLHDHGIVHRDIKPENILLSAQNPDDPYDIKLSDFGLAGLTGSGNERLMENVCGTPLYMAPEVVAKQGYSQQCDIWSIGILMYLLLRNYTKEAEAELIEQTSKGKITYDSAAWNEVSSNARNLLEKMLEVDPAMRMTAKEILQHPWITGQGQQVETAHHTVLEMMKKYKSEQRWKKITNVVIAVYRLNRTRCIRSPVTSNEEISSPIDSTSDIVKPGKSLSSPRSKSLDSSSSDNAEVPSNSSLTEESNQLSQVIILSPTKQGSNNSSTSRYTTSHRGSVTSQNVPLNNGGNLTILTSLNAHNIKWRNSFNRDAKIGSMTPAGEKGRESSLTTPSGISDIISSSLKLGDSKDKCSNFNLTRRKTSIIVAGMEVKEKLFSGLDQQLQYSKGKG
ncbi:kinase-like domain-containing protein [Paraphysoderma sedebokerense]|nr:kinase-like domain-containing protein [Paraphysoderma sedebokerense]